MATSPSIETQIDSFLEQFKKSASKAMEERVDWQDSSMNSVVRSRSSCFNLEAISDAEADTCSVEGSVGVGGGDGRGVAELLLPQYALLTGGRSKDGCPLITFPDHSNFHTLHPHEYQRLVIYLTSVPSLQEADLGFHLIIDRRKDRWNSIKQVLIRISEYFPGIIHTVYVLRPAGFLQKALSEVSSKLFKDEFKFKVVVCSSVEELGEYIDKSQLTSDLGGDLPYSHSEWIQQRITIIIPPDKKPILTPSSIAQPQVTLTRSPPDNDLSINPEDSIPEHIPLIEPCESTKRLSFGLDLDNIFSQFSKKTMC